MAGMLLSCLLSVLLPQAYQLTPELRRTATLISLIMSVLCPLQFIYGFCFFCLRAGGDTRNAMLLDSGYVMPLYNETYTWLLRDTFTGLHTDGMGVYYFQNVVKTSS